MKTFRILGALLCIFGCIFALLGVISSVIPLIENDQLTVIVNSFQETSTDPVTNTLNTIVLFCLHSGYFLLFCGISLTVVGGLISSSAHKRQNPYPSTLQNTSSSHHENTDAGVPKPAYYPGGIEPTAVSLDDAYKADDTPDVQIVSTINKLKAKPISGGVEPAFASDASDAERLMLNDEQLQSQVIHQRPSAPDYSQYNSNTPTMRTRNASPVDEISKDYNKPRIVSTIGKNKR